MFAVYNEISLAGGEPRESKPYAEELVGNLGVAPMPGSARVYDRTEKSMVECDAATCPLATRHMVSEYQRGSSGAQALDVHLQVMSTSFL